MARQWFLEKIAADGNRRVLGRPRQTYTTQTVTEKAIKVRIEKVFFLFNTTTFGASNPIIISIKQT
jgi:hypothetical protein